MQDARVLSVALSLVQGRLGDLGLQYASVVAAAIAFWADNESHAQEAQAAIKRGSCEDLSKAAKCCQEKNAFNDCIA